MNNASLFLINKLKIAPKLHKTGHCLRPIITTGAERFLKKLICPLLEKCEYSVDSTKKFKEKFLNDRVNFDFKKHEVFSIDAVSLFTSINVSRTIEFILDNIYDDLDLYFPQKEEIVIEEGVEKTKFIKPPKRDQLKEFFEGVLL